MGGRRRKVEACRIRGVTHEHVWYAKPIIIVFIQQQRAAIKNCLFIQARLFSIRPRTSTVSRACVSCVYTYAYVYFCMCVRARTTHTHIHRPARTTRRDFSAYQTVVSNFPPVRRFPACVEPGRRKKLPVTSAMARGGEGEGIKKRSLQQRRDTRRDRSIARAISAARANDRRSIC